MLLAQLPRQGHYQTQAGGGQWMPQRDRTTTAVKPLAIQLQRLSHCKHLSALRLVDFEQGDIVLGQAAALQQQLDRRHRADPHELRRHTDHRSRQQVRQYRTRTHRGSADQCGRCAVHHRTAVAGGLHAISMNRLQPGQRG
ncbi:hypothetical protein D3C76_1261400 [compost metagenome]